jgi:alginate O-acetyltransferase complex protein AlgI
MVFSSVIFVLAFLPFVLLIHSVLYISLNYQTSRSVLNLFLFVASILFYSWGEPEYVILLLCSALGNFSFAYFVGKSDCQSRRKMLMVACVCLNIMALIYFKYAGLFIPLFQLGELSSRFNLGWNIEALKVMTLPLGISFYTFQGISYLIDVYRKDIQPSSKFIDFGCYLTMFPQLVAGPIVRYASIESELVGRRITLEGFTHGATRFIIGLSKKILLADTLGRVADAAFSVPAGELTCTAAWIGILCYSFQIYYDFSGYSDMAIGIGKMIGFTFPENFNYPYCSRNIREFWQRWHITLSRWFRDYLYIPLGGNRKTKLRTACNLMVVFSLCGLWHGAAIGYLIWGLFHGLFLSIERIIPKFPHCLPRVLQHLYVIFVIMLGWVLFRTEQLSLAIAYYKSMLGLTQVHSFAVNEVWFRANGFAFQLALVCAFLFSAPVYRVIYQALHRRFSQANTLESACFLTTYYISMIVLLLLCFFPMFGATYNAFIYFRF